MKKKLYDDGLSKWEKIEISKYIGYVTREYLYENNFKITDDSYVSIVNKLVEDTSFKEAFKGIEDEQDRSDNINKLINKIKDYIDDCNRWNPPHFIKNSYSILCKICNIEEIPMINNYQANYYIRRMLDELNLYDANVISDYKYKTKNIIKWMDSKHVIHEMSDQVDDEEVKYWIMGE